MSLSNIDSRPFGVSVGGFSGAGAGNEINSKDQQHTFNRNQPGGATTKEVVVLGSGAGSLETASGCFIAKAALSELVEGLISTALSSVIGMIGRSDGI